MFNVKPDNMRNNNVSSIQKTIWRTQKSSRTVKNPHPTAYGLINRYKTIDS